MPGWGNWPRRSGEPRTGVRWSSALRDDHPASMDDLLRCYRDETARARAFVRTSAAW